MAHCDKKKQNKKLKDFRSKIHNRLSDSDADSDESAEDTEVDKFIDMRENKKLRLKEWRKKNFDKVKADRKKKYEKEKKEKENMLSKISNDKKNNEENELFANDSKAEKFLKEREYSAAYKKECYKENLDKVRVQNTKYYE